MLAGRARRNTKDYPELKSDANYRELMNELSTTENLIAQYRSNYNKQIKAYNRYVKGFEWCFDGEPIGSTVAVSSVGTQVNKEAGRLFKAGYEEMLRRLRPKEIIMYGSIPEWCEGNIIPVRAFQEKFRRQSLTEKK